MKKFIFIALMYLVVAIRTHFSQDAQPWEMRIINEAEYERWIMFYPVSMVYNGVQGNNIIGSYTLLIQ